MADQPRCTTSLSSAAGTIGWSIPAQYVWKCSMGGPFSNGRMGRSWRIAGHRSSFAFRLPCFPQGAIRHTIGFDVTTSVGELAARTPETRDRYVEANCVPYRPLG